MSAHPFGFDHPLRTELEHLLSVQGDIHRAKEALSFLDAHPRLFMESGVIAGALFTQALVSYVRCFTSGRRKALDSAIFDSTPELLKLHQEFKELRDRHVAHPVSAHEHVAILVAAEDEKSPGVGLGVRAWFYMGLAPTDAKKFMKLITFVDRHVKSRVVEVGNQLARKVMGEKATWRSAQKSFWSRVTHEQVYGPTKYEA